MLLTAACGPPRPERHPVHRVVVAGAHRCVTVRAPAKSKHPRQLADTTGGCWRVGWRVGVLVGGWARVVLSNPIATSLHVRARVVAATRRVSKLRLCRSRGVQHLPLRLPVHLLLCVALVQCTGAPATLRIQLQAESCPVKLNMAIWNPSSGRKIPAI